MQIQLDTDHQIQGSKALETNVDGLITQHLERFFPYLTRIEVHLADANGGTGGTHDRQCALEAHISSGPSVGVSHDDKTVEKAISGACQKMRTRLDSSIDQRRGHQA
jgi:hypothetical protein